MTRTGPTECQDGVTNNCTQECARDNTGVYTCHCLEGYNISSDSDSVCNGTFIIINNTHGIKRLYCIAGNIGGN